MTDLSVRTGEAIEEQVMPWWQCFISPPPSQRKRSFKGAQRFLFGDGTHPACRTTEWTSTQQEAPVDTNLAVKSPLTSVLQVSTMATPPTLSHEPSHSNMEGVSTLENTPGGTDLTVKSPMTSVLQVSTMTTPPTLSEPSCSNIKWISTRENTLGGTDQTVKSPLTSVLQVSTMTTPPTLSQPSCSNIKGVSTLENTPGGPDLAVKSPVTSVLEGSTMPTSSTISQSANSNIKSAMSSLESEVKKSPNVSNSNLLLAHKATEETIKTEMTSNVINNEHLIKTKSKIKQRHSCPLCNKTVTKKCHVVRHVASMHSIQNNLKPCCGFKFNTKSAASQHFQMFHKMHGYHCKMCNHSFKTPSLLRRHKIVHTKETPFKCIYCIYCTGLKNNLVRHMTKLHGTKPEAAESIAEYVCNFTDLPTIQPDLSLTFMKVESMEQDQDSNLSDLAILQPEITLTVHNSDIVEQSQDFNISDLAIIQPESTLAVQNSDSSMEQDQNSNFSDLPDLSVLNSEYMQEDFNSINYVHKKYRRTSLYSDSN